MPTTTRDRIVIAAIRLFNKEGFGSPSLYQLAQEINISRGNLTYYFKDKTALLLAIVEEMRFRYEKIMANTTQKPTWESTNNSTLAFHNLQRDYAFIFFDRSVLRVPEVKDQIKRIRAHHLNWQQSIVHFSISIGNMKKEAIAGSYDALFNTIWTMSFFWLMTEFWKENDTEKDWGRYVWSIILPHFTDQGTQAFIQHFGLDYFESLGPPMANFEQTPIGL